MATVNGNVLLRILCLHDSESNALELHQSIKVLDERLYDKHGVELVYINSPLIRQEEHPQQDDDNGPPRRIWWEQNEKQYTGLDASLLHLQQTWKSMPFAGILGVGRGAAIASLLPLIGVQGLKFGIFIRGSAILEDDEELISGWPCLHIMESNDEGSCRLSRQLGGEVCVTSKQHISNHDLNEIGKFVVSQKKRLHRESDALVVQSELHRVEQEAARVMAQHISQNPPRALMAIISPDSVGGWNRKRREPNEEGGGAPCPPDFLLQREKRAQHGGGRQHPQSEKKSERDATSR